MTHAVVMPSSTAMPVKPAMRVLVTGANGQLGYDVVRRLVPLGVECRGIDIEDLDITKADDVMDYVSAYAPTHIVHCAAYTAVDRAESDRELCWSVNVEGTKNIAEAAKNIGAKLVFFSTDYVYGGEGDTPFTVDSPTKPLNYYGETKLIAEREAALAVEGDNAGDHTKWQSLAVIRTSWVFGIHGGNFVKTMLRLGRERDKLTVVADQIGSPTYTVDLARLTVDMLMSPRFPAGLHHGTNEGFCSWYEFACAIIEAWGVNCQVEPITTEQYPTAAKRPHNSRLDKSGLTAYGLARLPSWRDALRRYLDELR